MPAAKAKPKKANAKAAAKPDAKPDPKPDLPPLKAIPLRRKSIWAIDSESPEFRAARRRDALVFKPGSEDRDGQQFTEAVLGEKDVQKWWK
ncbi:MAG TPA: antitoxin MazE-like protein [Xanthobacteraceae bacterium]